MMAQGNENQKPVTDEYRSNWEKIFGGNPKKPLDKEDKLKYPKDTKEHKE